MLIKKAGDITSSEITDKKFYLERRRFLQMASGTALTIAAASLAPGLSGPSFGQAREKLAGVRKSPLSTEEPLTPYEDITNYNNFYDLTPTNTPPPSSPRISAPSPGRWRSRGMSINQGSITSKI
jgi:sulfoxide reductase catalytic subunit YedY